MEEAKIDGSMFSESISSKTCGWEDLSMEDLEGIEVKVGRATRVFVVSERPLVMWDYFVEVQNIESEQHMWKCS